MEAPSSSAAPPADLVVFDLGTNTFRWLAVRWEATQAGRHGHSEAGRGREIIGLGSALARTGGIAETELAAGEALLRQWRPGAGIVPAARHVLPLGTQALRSANNREAAAERLGAALGTPVRIVEPEEEAALGFAGATWSWTGCQGAWGLLDIGGGSTELAWGTGSRFAGGRSLPVGVVTLAAPDDEPLGSSLERAALALDHAAGEVYNESLEALLDRAGPGMLASTCGTSSALAAAWRGLGTYDRDALDGCTVPLEWLDGLCRERADWTARDWHGVPGIGPRRAALIGPGIGILRTWLQRSGLTGWTNVESGLLEGAALRTRTTAHT